MTRLAALLRREAALAWRAGPAAPLGYFFGVTLLAPLAMGPERAVLAPLAGPLIWIAAALALLTTLERLFQDDVDDGELDQIRLADTPLELALAAKGAALWLAVAAPLALAAAPAAISLGAPPAAALALSGQLAFGAAGFIGTGMISAALAAGTRRAGVLIALLAVPFCAPGVIFGAGASLGQDGALPLLLSYVLAACALGPVAAAAALRAQGD
jgi:heme exporter protein B